MRININADFNIGDEVWHITTESEKTVICEICEGQGKLYSGSGKSHNCRICWGHGEVERDIVVVKKTRIDCIRIVLRSDSFRKKHNLPKDIKNISVEYSLETDFGSPVRMGSLFKTKVEAEQEIENRKTRTGP